MPSGQNRSFSNDATVLTTKTVSSWSNALDQLGLFNTAPNDDQCGLLDVDAPANDNQCALKEPIVASPEGFKLCIQKLCFASPLQWLPLMLGVPARSSDQVAYDGADTDDTPLSPSPQTPSPSMPRSPISPSPPSSSMLTEDGGADNDEYETVLGCARGVMEHSTGMIEHGEIESYLEGTYLEGKQLFDTFDTDGDGYLVKGEALVRGGEEKEWRHSLEEYDVDGDGQLGYDEFLALLAGRRESEVEEQVTLNVYNTTSMVPTDARNNYEWTADGYYYETHAYQKHLAQRSDQIRAAAASSALDTMRVRCLRDELHWLRDVIIWALSLRRPTPTTMARSLSLNTPAQAKARDSRSCRAASRRRWTETAMGLCRRVSRSVRPRSSSA